RLLGPNARVEILSPVAVWPAVEGAVADRGQIVRNELGSDFISFVHYGPESGARRLDRQGGGIADAAGDGPTRARGPIDGPDDRPLLLHGHTPLARIAVGADADVEGRSIGAGGQGLGPVMIEGGRQARHLFSGVRAPGP